MNGRSFVPYDDRTAIEQGSLVGRSRVFAWAADPVALFFLQVQGSGRLRLPDGGVMRIGYDSQNGRDYTGIGALMKARGLLGPGQTSMQGIVQWLHDHPDEGRAIMRENRSFVFFREQTGAPQGALGVAVAGGVSAAADPKYVPLGAPVLLSMDRADASRCGGAGHRRRDQGREPDRHVLGRWGGSGGDRWRHGGARHRVPAAARGYAGAARGGEARRTPDRRWPRVASTLTKPRFGRA